MLKLPLKSKEAYLVNDSLTIKYLIGLDLSEAILLYSDNPACFVDARYFSAVKPLIEEKGVTAILFKDLKDVKAQLKAQRIKRLFINFDKVTLSEYGDYLDLGAKIYDGSRMLKLVKAVKSDVELDSIKKACEITEKAFYDAIKHVKKGMTEIELRDILEERMLSLGGQEIAFETIVAFGRNSAVPHHQTGEDKLNDNSVILVDMGCKIDGYCSDITRTIYFGKPDGEFISRYNAVLKANNIAIENIKNKMTTDSADGYARNYLKEKGLSEYFTHSLGHGVGQEIHEFPSLSPKKSELLEDGMVFTIEPGVYFDGEYGIRIEDTVLLNYGKVKRLYSDDKNLLIIK